MILPTRRSHGFNDGSRAASLRNAALDRRIETVPRLCRVVLFVFVISASLGLGRLCAVETARLRVSDDGRHLVTERGKPFFWLGDTAWALFTRPKPADVELYLKDRAEKGFTVIQAVIGFYGQKNVDGHSVFIDDDPSRPNEAYFRNVDSIIDKAESLGLYVGVLPLWASSSARPDGKLFNLSNTSAARRYGRFLGRRYGNKPVIWILGGDWPGEGLEPIWRAMAEGLSEGDGGRNLITYHPRGGQHSSTWFHRDEWLDLNMIQSGHRFQNKNYEMIAADYARKPAKPVIDGEPGYEHITDGLKPDGPGVPKLTAWDVRRFAYCAVFAGAAGHTYGCSEVYQFWEPGLAKEHWGSTTPWRKALDFPGASQMRHLRKLIESRPMLLRIPDPSLIVGDAGKTLRRIEATRASDGSYAFIYTASGRPFTIRLEKLSGRAVTAYWYDPRSGQSHKIGVFPRKGDRKFTPPSSGPKHDWVLVLDNREKNFPVPGRTARAESRLPHWPGREWTTRPPAEVGLNPEKLAAFRRFVGGRGCVVRYGYLVDSWGDIGRRADVASACKPFFSHFLFKAIEVRSPSGRVSSWRSPVRIRGREENRIRLTCGSTWCSPARRANARRCRASTTETGEADRTTIWPAWESTRSIS